MFSPENSHRPFCSDRCKLIDLGEWAEGNYAIPVKPANQASADALDEEMPENHAGGLDEGDDDGSTPNQIH